MSLIKVKNKSELKKLVNDNSVNLKDLDVSNVTDMSNLFRKCQRDDYSGLEDWDMSKVTDIRQMFSHSNFDVYSADLSKWNLNSLPKECKSFDYFYKNVFKSTPFNKWFETKFNNFKKNVNSYDYFNVINLDDPEPFSDSIVSTNQKIRLPIKAKFIASPFIKGELLNEFFESGYINKLDEVDVSCIRDFSNVLAGSNRSNYDGIENWQTPNALKFDNFAKGAKNFNVCLNHFNFFNCSSLKGFLSETDYNYSLKFNLSSNLKDCSFLLADCYKFNSTIDCFVSDNDISEYTFNTFSAFSYCTSLSADKIPNFRKVAPNLATALSAAILSGKIRTRYNNENINEYNDIIDDLNNNPNFRDPIYNTMIVMCKDEQAQLKLEKVVDLKNHIDDKRSFGYSIQPLADLSESLEKSPCFLLQQRLYRDLTQELENNDIYIKNNKGQTKSLIDKEYVEKNFVFLSLRDYVTLSCFYWDHCRENNTKADFEPDFESLKIFDKYKYQNTKTSFNSLLNIINKINQNQTDSMTLQEIKTYNVLKTICDYGLVEFSENKDYSKEISIVKNKELIPKISKRTFK